MRVTRKEPHHELWIGANVEDLHGPVMLMHLGRGGVQEDGTLDRYNQYRVKETLRIARRLNEWFPHLQVTIVWTGKCNRKQDRSGAKLAATEAGAALAYADAQLKPGDRFAMVTEEYSTSTVENAIFTTRKFTIRGLLVVMTDPLHYTGGKVEFIMRLVIPYPKVLFLELPGTLQVGRKAKATHLVSAIITRIGMIGIARGDIEAIERRQKRLEKFTWH